MLMPPIQMYRLASRGKGGLVCDKGGVALGPADLVRVHEDAGRQRTETPPPMALARILSAAYGPQPETVVLRLRDGAASFCDIDARVRKTDAQFKNNAHRC
jgi:hypothetical protein